VKKGNGLGKNSTSGFTFNTFTWGFTPGFYMMGFQPANPPGPKARNVLARTEGPGKPPQKPPKP
jgi:hypothetical protein